MKKVNTKKKSPWIRRFVGVGISLVGFLGIFHVKLFFDSFADTVYTFIIHNKSILSAKHVIPSGAFRICAP